MRHFARLGLSFVLWVPVLGLAVWCASFLVLLADRLLSPGSPVRVSLRSEEGPVRIEAASFAFDPLRGRLFASGVVAVAPDGQTLAQASSLDVALPGFGTRDGLKVVAREVKGLLERLEDGSLRIARLFPDTGAPTEESATSIEVHGLAVAYVDRSATGPPVEATVTVPWGRFEAIGDQWVTTVQGARLAGEEGSLSGQAVGSTRSVTGRAATAGLDAIGWRNRLGRIPEAGDYLKTLGDWDAESVVADASVRFDIPTDGPWRLDGTGEGMAVGLRGEGALQADRVTASGRFTETSFSGMADAVRGGSRLGWTGLVTWDPRLTARGRTTVTAPLLSALPPILAKAAPKDLEIRDGKAEGALEFTDGGAFVGEWRVAGASVRWRDETLTHARGTIAVQDSEIRATLASGDWLGMPVSGGVSLSGERLGGSLVAKSVSLDRLADRFGVAGLTGSAALEATLGGTASNAQVAFATTGRAVYTTKAARKPVSGRFALAGEWTDGRIRLRRANASGNFGAVSASGSFRLPKETPKEWQDALAGASLAFSATGVDLGLWTDRATGLGFARGSVAMCDGRPIVEGRLEGYELALGDYAVALVASPFVLDGDDLTLPAFRAISDAGTLDAILALNTKRGDLDGYAVSGPVQIDRFDDRFIGDVWLDSATIGGTLEKPTVSGLVRAQGVRYEDVVLESASVPVLFAEGLLTMEAGKGVLGGGTVGLSGQYALDTRRGNLKVTLDGIEPMRWLRRDLRRADAAISVDGYVEAVFAEDTPVEVSGQGGFRNASVGGKAFDDGSWSFAGLGDFWTGAMHLRDGDEGFDGTLAFFDAKTQEIEARLNATGIPIERAVSALLPTLSDESKRSFGDTLALVTGKLTSRATFKGPINGVAFDVSEMRLADATYRDEPLGTIAAKANRSASGLWILDALSWRNDVAQADGPTTSLGRLDLQGRLQEKGDIEVDGEANNVDLGWLSRVVPGLPRLAGTADLALAASGTTDTPIGRASLRTSNLAVRPGDGQPDVAFGLNVDTIELVGRRLNAEGGRFTYRGITGELRSVDATLTDRFQVSDEDPISVRLELPSQAIENVADWFPSIRIGDQGAMTAGSLSLARDKGEWTVLGDLSLLSDAMRTTPGDFRLGPSAANFQLRREPGKDLALSGNVSTTGDGNLVGEARVLLQTPFDEATAVLDDPGRWRDLPIRGSLSLPDAASVSFNDPNYGAFASLVQGDLPIRGTVGRPEVTGTVALRNSYYKLPAVFAEGEASAPPVIDPVFNVLFETYGPVLVRAAGADVQLEGAGSLRQSLSNPRFEANLGIVSGFVQLPTGRLVLESDRGTVDVLYDATRATRPAQVVVRDANAVTYLSAPYGDDIERYRVSLEIDGDLLAYDDWTAIVRTRSDPDGLTRERILGILGQSDFFTRLSVREGFSRGVLGEALTRFALPTLLDPLTDRIARTIGLDYLGVDYNSFQGTSATVAKSLGNGLVLQARRQLSDPVDGLRRFDVRLSYRLPLRAKVFDRLTLSFGFDQLRPWKIALQYSARL